MASSWFEVAGEHPEAVDTDSGLVLCDKGPVFLELLAAGRMEAATGYSGLSPDDSVCGNIY